MPADTFVGSLVGVVKFAHDARTIDSEKVNQSATKGKAVIVLHMEGSSMANQVQGRASRGSVRFSMGD